MEAKKVNNRNSKPVGFVRKAGEFRPESNRLLHGKSVGSTRKVTGFEPENNRVFL